MLGEYSAVFIEFLKYLLLLTLDYRTWLLAILIGCCHSLVNVIKKIRQRRNQRIEQIKRERDD